MIDRALPLWPLTDANATLAAQPLWAWTLALLAYAYVASVLPVWTLLQPRDYINALQLISCLALIVLGLIAAAFFAGNPDPNNYEPYSRYKRIKTCLTIDELLNRPPTPPSPVQHNSVPSHAHAHGDDVNNHTAALSMQV